MKQRSDKLGNLGIYVTMNSDELIINTSEEGVYEFNFIKKNCFNN